MIRIILFLCLICAGCIPAQTPPQLEFTPGAPVVVTDQLYQHEAYQVSYPAGWRVITAAAENAGSVTLAAPDNQALVFISTSSIDNPPALPDVENQQVETREISLTDGTTIYTALVVDTEFQEAMQPTFDHILSSIDLPRLLIPTNQPRM
jgi:hypothetical protein